MSLFGFEVREEALEVSTGIKVSLSERDLKKILNLTCSDDYLDVLNFLGFDLNKCIVSVNRLSRSIFDNKLIEEGLVIEGTERRDKEWLNGGRSSLDNRAMEFGKNDPSKIRELAKFYIFASSTQETIDNLSYL